MIRTIWRRLVAHSMVARLLMAQMFVLCLLWLLALVYVVHDATRDKVTLELDSSYHAIIAIAENELGHPVKMQDSIRKVEIALREMAGVEINAFPGPSFIVENSNGLLYRSVEVPPGTRAGALGELLLFESGGSTWRSRTVQSTRSDVRITSIMPADGVNIFLRLVSRGTFLLPLLISFPFLILPAWLSIRLAQGPWTKAMADLATRGPQDLRPLPVDGRPRELVAMFNRINALLARVSDSAERERAFIADAAHELRTPLAAMRVNVEALQRQASDPRQQQLLDGIVSGNARATRLVGQLLGLMRSDATSGDQDEQICFDALVQERMAALAGIADAKGVELELSGDEGLHLSGRREGLVSLVDNLLDNAIKYSPERGKVLADVRRADGSAVLRISDQGPGITPELRERVFDRFFRDPRQAQAHAGSGLGLAIALAVARQHGGSIALDAAGSMGLCVTVRMPLSAGNGY
ncbi:two-component system, OmpR family, sensor histidine kinase QseC [Duganella sp. CF458]|uniref:sensor histidine kinase n=1 Tax=Duganella sp. CF458 TaxID=1884368 RepID=UPI0008F388DD|nr:ATP-binding protein [Duganella sp. CF458]SFF74029.1 two-component system, OmpR family, sensor histidine kinase QseC [Duganella sp. CF458]